MTILIIGNSQEAHSAHIFEKITRQGGRAVYFDSTQFPTQIQLSYSPSLSPTGQLIVGKDGVELSQIRSVYWRYFMGISTEHLSDAFLKEMAYREIQSAVGSLFRILDALWVNSPQAIDDHFYKGYQLNLMAKAGIRVPETLISNDPERVITFFETQNQEVIFKPVAGGAHTEKLSSNDFTKERLAELSQSPVQFQEFIPGMDIRVYVIGNELFAAEIQSKVLDFRNDPDAPIVPIQLPHLVEKDCFTVKNA
ncbi:MAG: hypothetical protein K2X66_06605, partial [Cyanobacteria bacterium]|nr:hypothetical protein [Cyanobacteriota bacterium]